MFNAITTAEKLTQFVDTALTLVDEATIHLETNCLRLAAVDPANVAMVSQSLGATAFESYEADGGEIGVNLVQLADVLKMCDSDELVHLELGEQIGKRKLHIEGETMQYDLALIDPDSIREEPTIPDLDLNGKAVIHGRNFDQAVRGAALVSDHIELGFRVDGGDFYAKSEGDTDDVTFEYGGDDLLDGTHFDADAESLFSLDYLKDMKKPIGSDTELRVEVGVEHPVKLHYSYADGDGVVTNMLAPRIDAQ